jgi:flagellar motor switch protein FliM
MEVFSQDEIDQILFDINHGNARSSAKSRRIKIYDFLRPDRFSGYKGEIKAIHNNLARLWTKLIPQYIQKDAHFYCESVDTVTYEEFVRSVHTPTFFMIAQGFLDSVPLPRSFVIEVDPDLSIEQSTLNEISKSMLNEYSLIWNKYYNMKMEFSLKATETDSRYLDVDSPREMGALITIEAILNDTEGKINIYLPYLFMKPLLPYLTRVRSRESFDENFNQEEDIMDNRYKSAIETGLDNVKVQVIVELGRAVKTLKEIHETKEGTIMSLDAFAGENVDIFVNNVLFGRGEVVVPGENFGVRFTEIVGQEEKGSGADRTSDQPSAPNADGEIKKV